MICAFSWSAYSAKLPRTNRLAARIELFEIALRCQHSNLAVRIREIEIAVRARGYESRVGAVRESEWSDVAVGRDLAHQVIARKRNPEISFAVDRDSQRRTETGKLEFGDHPVRRQPAHLVTLQFRKIDRTVQTRGDPSRHAVRSGNHVFAD